MLTDPACGPRHWLTHAAFALDLSSPPALVMLAEASAERCSCCRFCRLSRLMFEGRARSRNSLLNLRISGVKVRDAQGRKMSKSLGNVVDPLDSISEYGADALRYTLATGEHMCGKALAP